MGSRKKESFLSGDVINKHSVCATPSHFPSAHFTGHEISLSSFGLRLSQALCEFFPSFFVHFHGINSLNKLILAKKKDMFTRSGFVLIRLLL